MKQGYWLGALALASVATSTLAEDRVQASHIAGPTQSETLHVDIRTPDGPLWSGTLTLGPQYGNAYFSQSKNEFALPCDNELTDMTGMSNTNSSLSFNISRNNWQQEPNKFNITFNWTKALRACEGQGNDTFGFNRVVDLAPGHSVTIEGANGARVVVSRKG